MEELLQTSTPARSSLEDVPPVSFSSLGRGGRGASGNSSRLSSGKRGCQVDGPGSGYFPASRNAVCLSVTAE